MWKVNRFKRTDYKCKFTPKEDISIYELAVILGALIYPLNQFYCNKDEFEGLSENIRKHIEVI